VTEFVSIYGIWVVATFIALESVGIPLPAEAALIAAGFLAARTHALNIWSLIAVSILAAILGEIVGFWIGRKFGQQLVTRYGARLGFTEGRVRIGQRLFVRYGGRFVFIARFLPFLRNMAAVLAGMNAMARRNFCFASATAAAAWITCYGLAAYCFGEAFANLASPAAVFLGLGATLLVLAVPATILRYEKRLLANAKRAGLASRCLRSGMSALRKPSSLASRSRSRRHGLACSGLGRTIPIASNVMSFSVPAAMPAGFPARPLRR
jgi:membrane protein DedA with SNARE-associated domain